MQILRILLPLLLLLSCSPTQVQPKVGLAAGALTTADKYNTLTYVDCAAEWQTCTFSGTRVVRFGASGAYTYGVYTNSTRCDFRVLGDPLPGKTKICSVSTTDPSAPDPGVDAGICSCPCQGPADAGVPMDAGKPDTGLPDSGAVADSGRVDSGGGGETGPPPGGTASRPSTSKGVGFFTIGNKLYDANGKEFRMRGTNKTHQDFWAPGLGNTKSNTTRWIIYFTEDPDRAIRDMQSPSIGGTTTNGKAVQVPGFWDGTCKSDSGSFNTMVNRWVRDAKKYQTIEYFTVMNIANEWGSDEIAWRDAYISAIPKIRAAGWNGTIMVDAPGCGQNGMAIARHGQAILAADPQKNTMFSWHIYGLVYDSQGGVPKSWAEQIDLVPTMDALRATNLTVIVGEFGPKSAGLGPIFPSPTAVTPERIIEVAEAHGIGWLSWSWDDNNTAGGRCVYPAFCHSLDGNYNSAADLTPWGKIMVDMWSKYATRASIFN